MKTPAMKRARDDQALVALGRFTSQHPQFQVILWEAGAESIFVEVRRTSHGMGDRSPLIERLMVSYDAEIIERL